VRGGIPLPNQFVFISECGGALRKSNLLRRWWHPLLKSVGIESGGFHRMRHTHATFVLKQTDHVTVQKRLGHADAATTLGRYGGSTEGQDEAASRAIERITLAGANGNSVS
jgi:integrase